MKALKSQRLHIGFFGKTNAGKSSVINSITGQDVSIVSDIAGTTTDVVEKSMELLPIGAVTLLDTAGINDTSELGKARIEKTLKIIDRTDIGVIVCEYNNFDEYEERLIEKFNELKIPYLILVNKTDLTENITTLISKSGRAYTDNVIFTSATTDKNIIYKFKEELVRLLPEDFVAPPKIAGDLVEEKSTVILVIPIPTSPTSRPVLSWLIRKQPSCSRIRLMELIP